MELPKDRKLGEQMDPGVAIFYGPPKVGKTTLIDKLDNNLILDLEKGTKYLNALSVNIIGIKTPSKEKEEDRKKREKENEYYLDEVGKAVMTAGRPYDYITLDTATEFEEMLKPVALEMYRNTPMGEGYDGNILDLPRGAGYYWLREAFKLYIDKLKKLTPRLILIGHLKETVISKGGKEVNAKDLDLTGKIKTIACAGADAIGYVYRGENSELRINFKTADEITCGARCQHLRGQDIKIADYDAKTNELVNVNWALIYPDKFK